MDKTGAELLTILKDNLPFIVALVALWYRGVAADAKLHLLVKELELKLKENHDKVERDNANKSDVDIVNDAINGSSPRK